MITFIVERTVPPALHIEDPDNVALHSRWATDAYRAAGVVWFGGLVTDRGMFSLVAAEAAEDLERYRISLGIAEADMGLRRVLRPVGPFFAAPRT